MENIKELNKFKGLNNVVDPMRGTDIGLKTQETWGWQSVAENVNITNADGVALREGYTPFLTGTDITASFSSADHTKAYIIDSGVLKLVHADSSVVDLYSGLPSAVYWAEVNDVVYLSGARVKLRIYSGGAVEEWGMRTPMPPAVGSGPGNLPVGMYSACVTLIGPNGEESGASEPGFIQVGEREKRTYNTKKPPNASQGVSIYVGGSQNDMHGVYLTGTNGTTYYHVGNAVGGSVVDIGDINQIAGRALATEFSDPPPVFGAHIAFLGARAYVAEYLMSTDQTVIWFSRPFSHHLFDLTADYFIVPGEVTQLFAAGQMLLVTTQTRVFMYDSDKLTQLAEYGAPEGQHADVGPDGLIYFWSKRGLCRLMPFENLTESRVSLAQTNVSGCVVERDGHKRYVALTNQSGDAFNRRVT